MIDEKKAFMELYEKVKSRKIDPSSLDDETLEKVEKMLETEIEIRNENLIKKIEKCKRIAKEREKNKMNK